MEVAAITLGACTNKASGVAMVRQRAGHSSSGQQSDISLRGRR